MPIKYFCDECEDELTEDEVRFCHEMIGYGMFCKKHIPVKEEPAIWKYTKKWDKDTFPGKITPT